MKFSVIIPVYNCQDYLRSCIDSVLNQTYKDWELILIDDGSSDESGNICEKYAIKYDNIFVAHLSNSGPSIARNVGLKKSKGEYCIFIDSDDILDEKALQTLFSATSKKRFDLIVFGYKQVNYNNGSMLTIKEANLENKSYYSNDQFASDYIKLDRGGYTHPVWNKAFRRELLDQNNILFPERVNMSEDFIFNLHVFKVLSSACLINRVLYTYISYNDGTITTTFNINKMDSVFSVYIKSFNFMSEWQPGYLYLVENEFIRNLSVFINSLFNKKTCLSYLEKRSLVKKIIHQAGNSASFKKLKPYGIRNKLVYILIKYRQVDLLLLTGKISRLNIKSIINVK